MKTLLAVLIVAGMIFTTVMPVNYATNEDNSIIIDDRDELDCQSTQSEEMVVELQLGEHKINVDGTGTSSLTYPGSDIIGLPGAPALPVKKYRLLLPPNADPDSVIVNLIADTSEHLSGKFSFSKNLPPATFREDGSMYISEEADYSWVYSLDSPWPDEIIGNREVHYMRQAPILTFDYYPCQFIPTWQEVIEHTDVKVSVSWKQNDKTLSDPLTLKFLSRMKEDIDNFEIADKSYNNNYDRDSTGSTYAIIATNDILDNCGALEFFWDFLEAKGFSVLGVTEDDYGYTTGKQRVLNIRQWLINHYVSDSIEYVLLIGNPDPYDETHPAGSVRDLPMLMCSPRHGSGDGYENSPTDYFYADLTGNWDKDGDGYYGEYIGDGGTGGVDFYSEVLVGRIPFYGSYTDVNNILTRTMNYDGTCDEEWKQHMLLPMAISNYANEDRLGWARTDGLDLPQNVFNNILTPVGMDGTVMYEGEGLSPVSPSAYHYDMDINEANFISEFNQGYGTVFWWAHGGNATAYRKYWYIDDGDGVPEYGEMNWVGFVDNSMVSLQTDQPAFFYQASCNNGAPEHWYNLGHSLLKRGAAINTISSTRVSWYMIGTWNPTWSQTRSDNAGIGYFYFDCLLNSFMTVGESLYTVTATTGHDWEGQSWMNKMDFNIYGDPSLLYYCVPPTVTVTQPNTALAWPQGSSQTITWTTTPGTYSPSTVDIYYSAVGAYGPYEQIAVGEPDDGSFIWSPIPNIVSSTNCYVLVVVTDRGDFVESDISDVAFSITNIRAPIRIDADSDFDSAHGVTGGSGTASEPWIIEGWIIDGSGYGYCAYIGNTTKHFILRNCEFYGANGAYNFPYYTHAGVTLYNAQNGVITCNEIHSNNRTGIYLLDSSNNNEVTENNCSNNLYRHGIGISDSLWNVVISNDCLNNGQAGIGLWSSSFNYLAENVCVSNGNYGIYCDNSENNSIESNICKMNYAGLVTTSASNTNTLSGNNCTDNNYGIANNCSNFNIIDSNYCGSNHDPGGGIGIWESVYCEITNNFVTNNDIGLNLETCDYAWIAYNTVSHNTDYGIYMKDSNENAICHNNIISNNIQASVWGVNEWDDGYPLGGNYWSNHVVADYYCGPGQDIPGGDGICDSAYLNGPSLRDNYPLMAPWGLKHFNISLQAGWNLISIPLRMEDYSIPYVLDSIYGKWDSVKYYDSEDVNRPWKSYKTGGMVNNIENIYPHMGIWIHTTEACQFTIPGHLMGSTGRILRTGWNLVGYPTLSPLSAYDTLSGTGADIISVYQSASPYILDITDLSTVTMVAGNGYWVHVPADTWWIMD
jgi:parallel beta-helix repeat protein